MKITGKVTVDGDVQVNGVLKQSTGSERKSVAVMDVVAVLTKVVQQQQEVISRLGDEVTELRRTCEQLLAAPAVNP